MDVIQSKVEAGISIHPISFEEIGKWDHVAVVTETDRVLALREMYNILVEENHINLILWDDPNHPSHDNLPENILDGWSQNISFIRKASDQVIDALEKQINSDLQYNQDHPENIRIFTDYTQGFTSDMLQASPNALMTVELGTYFTSSKARIHADSTPSNVFRYLSALSGDRPFFARNEDAVMNGDLWTVRDSNNAIWYQPPESTVALISNKHQKDIPSVHTMPFAQSGSESKKRERLMVDVEIPDGP